MDMKNTELEEIYKQLGGNYDVILKRLRKESMIRTFMEDFLEDDSFSNLEKAMEMQNDRAAFEAVHTLKGVALNMEFGLLAKSASELTEALRHGRKPNANELYLAVKQDYWKTVQIIKGEADAM